MNPSRIDVPTTNIHASCVAVGGHGLLLLGESGQGKSDLALRLIDRGAQLVADDRCLIWPDGGQLWCRPPEELAGKLEVRGLGIVDQPWTKSVPLILAVRLASSYDRMPPTNPMESIAGHPLPTIRLSAFEASAPIKIARAIDLMASAA